MHIDLSYSRDNSAVLNAVDEAKDEMLGLLEDGYLKYTTGKWSGQLVNPEMLYRIKPVSKEVSGFKHDVSVSVWAKIEGEMLTNFGFDVSASSNACSTLV